MCSLPGEIVLTFVPPRPVARWSPEKWYFSLAVFLDGVPVGCQVVSAKSFSVTRSATAASWLVKRFRRSGIGTEMRQAIVHLASDGLGAQSAVTSCLVGDLPSERVSAKLGYVPSGRRVCDIDGVAFSEQVVPFGRAD